MVDFNRSPCLTKEGKHYRFRDLEMWAEEGIVVIENQKDGNIDTVFRRDIALRAAALNLEAKRAYWQEQRDELNEAVIKMHEVWKDAKQQGDPQDPEVIRQKVRERRRAVLITGW